MAVHAKSGLRRFASSRRNLEAAHAAETEAGGKLARRAGALLGTGALAGAGLLGLSGGSAGATAFATNFFTPTCFPTAGTVDGNGNNACALGFTGISVALSGEGGTAFNNSAFADIAGGVGGFAGAFAGNLSGLTARNSAIAASDGGLALAGAGNLSHEAFRDTASATAGLNGVALAGAGNFTVTGVNARNAADAVAGAASFALSLAANNAIDSFRNTAYAESGGFGNSVFGGAAVALAANNANESTNNQAWAAANSFSFSFAAAGEGAPCETVLVVGIAPDQVSCITNQHNNSALATANLGSTAIAIAAGAKSYQYNDTAEAGAVGAGSALAVAGSCDTSGCGGSDNTALASSLAGGTTSAVVNGNNTGIATASGPASSSVTETDTSSTLTTSANPGGMAYATDGNANWALSLNFNGTPINLSNTANG